MDQTTTPATHPSGPTSVGRDWYGAAGAQVIAFFGRLKRVPIAVWHRSAQADPHIGAREPGAADEAPAAVRTLREEQADQVARARLRDAMETMPGVVRRIRRRIDQEMAIVDGIATPETVTRMRRAARLAACAVAARPLLTPDDFARLYRPMADVIPPHELSPQ